VVLPRCWHNLEAGRRGGQWTTSVQLAGCPAARALEEAHPCGGVRGVTHDLPGSGVDVCWETKPRKLERLYTTRADEHHRTKSVDRVAASGDAHCRLSNNVRSKARIANALRICRLASYPGGNTISSIETALEKPMGGVARGLRTGGL